MAVKSDTTNNTLTYLSTHAKNTHIHFRPHSSLTPYNILTSYASAWKPLFAQPRALELFFYKEIGLNSKPTYFALSKACMYVD